MGLKPGLASADAVTREVQVENGSNTTAPRAVSEPLALVHAALDGGAHRHATAEVLKRDGQDSPNLRIAAIQEERQRLDVMAVRIPTKAILGLAAAVAERLSQASEKGPKPVKK